jgi:hypothetical protein
MHILGNTHSMVTTAKYVGNHKIMLYIYNLDDEGEIKLKEITIESNKLKFGSCRVWEFGKN